MSRPGLTGGTLAKLSVGNTLHHACGTPITSTLRAKPPIRHARLPTDDL